MQALKKIAKRYNEAHNIYNDLGLHFKTLKTQYRDRECSSILTQHT
jgi:hypothetical protein